MTAALQAALVLGAWTLVILMLTTGLWYLRQHRLLHWALKIIGVLVGLFLLMRLHELLLMLAIAGVVAFILDALVERLARRIPRPAAIAVVYLALIVGLVLAGTFLIPRAIREAHQFILALPKYTEQANGFAARLTRWYGGAPEQVQTAVDSALAQLQAASRGATAEVEKRLLGILGWSVRSVLILVMSIYLLLDKRNLHTQFLQLFSSEMRPEAETTRAELALTFSRYLRGQLTVILFVAVAVTVGLLLFRIPYAFFIGLMAGVLEVIPYFGAFAGAVPAVILGFLTRSPTVGFALIAFFILINQIEGHVIIPLVMGGHLEMRPITILLALIAGEMLLGVAGMIIAIPVVSFIRVLIPHVRKHYHYLKARERPPGGEGVKE